MSFPLPLNAHLIDVGPLVYGCMAQIVPERVMACPATETNFVGAGKDLREDTFTEDYIFYVWTEGGYGARHDRDNGTFMTLFASGSMNQSAELYEQEAGNAAWLRAGVA